MEGHTRRSLRVSAQAIHAAHPDIRLVGGESREQWQYTEARRAAARGDGAAVKRMAAALP